MQQLNALVKEANELAMGTPESEADRMLQICNACRYCEGFCAVFPAMTRRIEFTPSVVNYLANLCHNCGACLHACQYAPPHEFGVNIPRVMAQVRKDTYMTYAWPKSFGVLYKSNGVVVSVAISLSIAFFLLLSALLNGSLSSGPLDGNFYAVFSHNTLALMFGAVFGFSILAIAIGLVHFWRGISAGAISASAAAEATHDALTLKYLGGGHGDGCNNEDDAFSLWRKRFHHFTFYGFMMCFAATSVATIYHYFLGLHAPYALNSLPVILGTLGGIGLLIGPAGLLYLNLQRNSEHGDASQKPMDRAFIVLLFMISISGLLLLAYRDTSAMVALLAVHLGFVMSFFLTMPYGKFAHGFYRVAALLKNSIEKRQKNHLQFGAD
ncbi:tricarballylate utilization protein B [Polynucleobacter sp. QLW-P1DATA-2]|jgi:citrate/tricarballylate utilization protein|uniref:tricarballylate utilization 4Fe-4S protein TcuB n=1 Tax=unclassified Polynucleobacter TaxID=2640945 RepID=UPI0008F9716A|nr:MULTISPECIES: tricarballylate utilization 4Fe-4S protein TcuB [unclassified Polynucleobacter]OIM98392.1 tricarballylate utilization protein B [Polynucleobacter sp. MWH-Tro8-2-5-gr]OIN00302.1 tricarballylate utilization protein B [Polynucleobacter sp. QLW-P1DATA-2]